MRYKVGNLEVRSENAAKPIAQAARPLVEWLRQMEPVGLALDYGCGKLRYSGHLAKRCSRLTLVDSGIQLDRVQKIAGRQTTVREFVKRKWPTSRVLAVEEFEEDGTVFDFVLCANVLSAIPREDARSRVLHNLHRRLAPGGSCLFVTQYRNSDFRKMAASKNARRHLDGWILVTKRGAFYYGILDRRRLEELVTRHGFRSIHSWLEGQSAYVLATREEAPNKALQATTKGGPRLSAKSLGRSARFLRRHVPCHTADAFWADSSISAVSWADQTHFSSSTL